MIINNFQKVTASFISLAFDCLFEFPFLARKESILGKSAPTKKILLMKFPIEITNTEVNQIIFSQKYTQKNSKKIEENC